MKRKRNKKSTFLYSYFFFWYAPRICRKMETRHTKDGKRQKTCPWHTMHHKISLYFLDRTFNDLDLDDYRYIIHTQRLLEHVVRNCNFKSRSKWEFLEFWIRECSEAGACDTLRLYIAEEYENNLEKFYEEEIVKDAKGVLPPFINPETLPYECFEELTNDQENRCFCNNFVCEMAQES